MTRERIRKCKWSLEKSNLDALLLCGEENVRYMTGFTGDSSWAMVTREGGYLFTDGRFIEQAQKQCEGIRCVLWEKPMRPHGETILKYAREEGVQKIGVEASKITLQQFNTIKDVMEDILLIPSTGIVERLRMQKDEEELSYLKKACSIADLALQNLIPQISVGVSELDLANELVYQIKKLGAEKEGFDTICISGKKTSMPHGQPDHKKLEQGDFLTIDFGAKYHGYISDMTRTFVLGKANPKQIEIYEIVRKAHKNAVEALQVGIGTKEIDEIVRKTIGEEYLKYYYPGMGHGVGLFLHEQPFISNTSEDSVLENVVMTIEPGLYIPGFGGVRIEDTLFVGREKTCSLTNFERALIEIE